MNKIDFYPGMTYADAIAAGYRDADRRYQRGYLSRKTDPNAAPVQVAGGHRKGDLYVLRPCYHSTNYCIRQYLRR